MDKQLVQAAVGLAVVTALGAFAGSGPDRGVVDVRSLSRASAAKPDARVEPLRLAQGRDAPGEKPEAPAKGP
jgi:hypothetical protein